MKENQNEWKETALLKRLSEKLSSDTKVTDARGRNVGSVKLRTKRLKDGSLSLYLDIYKNGKRSYQFLDIHLKPSKVKTPNNVGIDNENGILSAEMERLDTMERMRQGKEISSSNVINLASVPLVTWMDEFAENRKEQGRSVSHGMLLHHVKRHLGMYNGDATLADIDKNFGEGFIRHLSSYNFKGRTLAQNTQHLYYKLFHEAVVFAANEGVIDSDPLKLVSPPRTEESKRAHLDIDELKKMISTECKNIEVKNAYLFSCFTGLRYSDVYALTWGNVTNRNGKPHLEIIVKKTNNPLILPLSPMAQKWMGERSTAKDKDKVFRLNERPDMANNIIRDWAEAAGISKHLTFHTARHTFATSALTAGVDLYTISKMLDHSDVVSTQVYVKVVDKKKDEAVMKMDNLFNCHN